MNERIRQLLSQAGVHYEVLPKDTVYEKFAELIITETCRILAENKEFRAATLVGRHFPLWK